MIRYDTIDLISENPAAHGLYDAAVTETARTVFAEVASVGMKEAYTAMSQGLNPEVRFKLALMEDYCGERKLLWRNIAYRVLRTYMTDDGGIELTCGRWSDDV